VTPIGAGDRADQRSSGRSPCTVAKPGPSARKQQYCGPSEPPQEFAKGFRQESFKVSASTFYYEVQQAIHGARAPEYPGLLQQRGRENDYATATATIRWLVPGPDRQARPDVLGRRGMAQTYPRHPRDTQAYAATRLDEGSVWSTQSRVRASWAGPTSHCRPGGWAPSLGAAFRGFAGRSRDRDHWRDDCGPVGSVWRTQSHVR